MDGIPYIDELIREYLLFRGYVKTFAQLNGDSGNDRTSVTQVREGRHNAT